MKHAQQKTAIYAKMEYAQNANMDMDSQIVNALDVLYLAVNAILILHFALNAYQAGLAIAKVFAINAVKNNATSVMLPKQLNV